MYKSLENNVTLNGNVKAKKYVCDSNFQMLFESFANKKLQECLSQWC